MSATLAAVLIGIVVGGVVTWVTMWRRDSAQQVELDDHDADLDHLTERVDRIANRVDVLEREHRP